MGVITIDKSKWPSGIWHNEPDEMEWTDGETGLLCRIKRTTSGYLCGYVGLPKGFSMYGHPADHVDSWCHGGLNFAGPLDIHTGLWFFGFDCGHSWDVIPSLAIHVDGQLGQTYRDVTYVKANLETLCRQLFNPMEALAACHSVSAP